MKKSKSRIALLLAVVLICSLVLPISSFAANDTNVDITISKVTDGVYKLAYAATATQNVDEAGLVMSFDNTQISLAVNVTDYPAATVKDGDNQGSNGSLAAAMTNPIVNEFGKEVYIPAIATYINGDRTAINCGIASGDDKGVTPSGTLMFEVYFRLKDGVSESNLNKASFKIETETGAGSFLTRATRPYGVILKTADGMVNGNGSPDHNLPVSFTYPGMNTDALTATKITVPEGGLTVPVPTAEEKTHTLLLTCTNTGIDGDYSGTDATTTWSIDGTVPAGISISGNTITVEPTAAEGSVTVKASTVAGGVTKTDTATVTITKAAAPVATTVKLYKDGSTTALGDNDTAIIPAGDTANTYTYAAKVFDQYGKEMTGASVSYVFTAPTSSVTWNAETKTLSVAKGADKDAPFTLTATSSLNDKPFASVTITVKDIEITWPTVTVKANPIYGDTWYSILTLTGGSAQLDGTNVPGTFTVKDSNILLNAGNQGYVIHFQSTDEKYSVDKDAVTVPIGTRTLTVTPDRGLSKAYGAADPTLTYVSSGALSGQTPDFTGALARGVGENVGSYAINKGTLALKDNDTFKAANYNLVLASETVNFTINKATITITSTAPSKTYLANADANANAEALKTAAALPGTVDISYNGKTDTVGIVWADATQTFNPKGGTYTYVGTVAENGNYANRPTLTATVTVTPVKVTGITMSPTAITKAMSEVKSAADYAALGLPAAANAAYDQSVTKPATASITGWSKTLAQLKAINATNADVKTTLTPTISWPAWATVTATVPTLEFTVTPMYPVTVSFITAIADVTYGAALAAPEAKQTDSGKGVDAGAHFDYTYYAKSGSNWTKLDAAPTAAGSYKVVATLVSDTHSGSAEDLFTIAQKEVGLTWTDPSSLVYDGTAKTMTATATGLVGSDTCTVTVTGGTQTNAGTYTAKATGLSNPNYKLPSGVTHDCTIAKADRTIGGLSDITFTIDKTSETLKPSVSADADKSAKYTYISSEPGIITVTSDGDVTAVGNGTANITVTVPTTKNYNAATATVAVTSDIRPISGVIAFTLPTNVKLAAKISGRTITISGFIPAGSGIIVADDRSDVITIAADKIALGTKLTVDGVEYTIVTSGVIPVPANEKVSEGAEIEVPSGVDPAKAPTGSTVSGVAVAVADKVIPEAQQQGTKLTAEQTTSLGGADNVVIEAEVKAKVSVTAVKENEIDLIVTPTVTYVAKDKTDESKSVVLTEPVSIESQLGMQLITVSVTVPKAMFTTPDNVVIAHKMRNGVTEYRSPSHNPGGDAYTFTWTQHGASPVTLTQAGAAASKIITMTFQNEDGTTYTQWQYSIEGVNEAFPTLTKSGYTFNGWKIGDNAVSTVLTRAIFDSITGTAATAKPSFTATFSGGSGTASKTFTITASAGDNGKIAPSGSVTVNSGDDRAFTFTPNNGYVVKEILVDGKAITTASSYTFKAVTDNHTISVSFEKGDVLDKFVDVKGHWAENYIRHMVEKGYMSGTSTTRFAPDATTTRAMLVNILYSIDGKPAVTGASTFSDVPAGQWYTNAVLWAAANKIISGVGGGRFNPMGSVTREQMALILYTYTAYKNGDLTGAADLSKCTDTGSIHAWALTAMKWAVNKEIITGRTTTTLVPGGSAKRCEVAAMLNQYLTK